MSQDKATNLYTALLAAQRAMGPVRKNATNPHLKSKYADLTSVLDTIEQPLWDNGLLVVQRFTHDQGGAILVTELIHAASGERLTSEVPVVSKDPTDPQKIGAAITYYRRYSLLALLGLAPEDDDGHMAAQPRPQSANQLANYGLATYEPANQTAPQRRTPPPPSDPRPAVALTAAGPPQPSDEQLLDMIRNDFASPDERWDALWDYYDRATTVAELNRRALEAKASGMPERDLKAAHRQKHNALAGELAPPASIAG